MPGFERGGTTTMTHQFGVILAGGQSQRFGGAGACPKPVVKINGSPMVLWAAAQLVQSGARRICVLTGQNHAAICHGLGLGQPLVQLQVGDVSVPFELRPSGVGCGTGGRLLALTAGELEAGALIAYTDVFTRSSLTELKDLRRSKDAALAILTMAPGAPWGIVEAADGRVKGFAEKPVLSGLQANAGIFAADQRILSYIHDRSEMLEAEPMQRMINAGLVVAHSASSAWTAIDSPKDLPKIESDPDCFIDGCLTSRLGLFA